MRVANPYVKEGSAFIFPTPYGELMLHNPRDYPRRLKYCRYSVLVEDLVDLACGIERSEN